MRTMLEQMRLQLVEAQVRSDSRMQRMLSYPRILHVSFNVQGFSGCSLYGEPTWSQIESALINKNSKWCTNRRPLLVMIDGRAHNKPRACNMQTLSPYGPYGRPSHGGRINQRPPGPGVSSATALAFCTIYGSRQQDQPSLRPYELVSNW